MLRLLRFLFTGSWDKPPHEHRFHLLERQAIYAKDEDKYPTTCRYVLKCNCGEIKVKDI